MNIQWNGNNNQSQFRRRKQKMKKKSLLLRYVIELSFLILWGIQKSKRQGVKIFYSPANWENFVFLLSSDIRSEGSRLLQSSRNSTSIFWWISILYHSHILKKCFRKISMCVRLSLSFSLPLSLSLSLPLFLSLCLTVASSKVVPKLINYLVPIRYLESSCKDLDSFSPTPKIKGSWHKKMISIFSKMAETILIKFFGFIVHSKPKIWH